MVHPSLRSSYVANVKLEKLQKQGREKRTLSTMFLCPWVENRDNGNDDDDKKDEYGNTQPFP
ncbi:hypothetical protein F2Q70_00009559 [Brassica cretica]|uniref:Uncharacterized protein n=1 Tax=Brassica cretica TaxID=69181 RepID=A0A8S9MCL4_BRACR|nr:hypothetical protein F2Q68_00002596 [Brassica cretica]KAF2615908.1 hypothetical protein F2Q70_00009559 [Brassica cretica]